MQFITPELSPMAATGRPPIIDDALQTEICRLISAGHSIAACARAVGCDVKTIRRRLQRDAQFRRQVGAAEIKASSNPLAMVRRAASDNWRAAAWLLERSEPHRFGRSNPGTCRLGDVAKSFTRFIELALQQTPAGPQRRQAYHVLSEFAERESMRLQMPPKSGANRLEVSDTPLLDEQRTFDVLDAVCTANAPFAPNAPFSSTTDAKTHAGNSSRNPGSNER
jgi:hypothetical protein